MNIMNLHNLIFTPLYMKTIKTPVIQHLIVPHFICNSTTKITKICKTLENLSDKNIPISKISSHKKNAIH